jgi:hypothetical protein
VYLSKDDTNDSIVLVPPYHIGLAGAAAESLNNVFDKATPQPFSVPQGYLKFKEQQEKGSL